MKGVYQVPLIGRMVTVHHTRKTTVKRSGAEIPPSMVDVISTCCCWPDNDNALKGALLALHGITRVEICTREQRDKF